MQHQLSVRRDKKGRESFIISLSGRVQLPSLRATLPPRILRGSGELRIRRPSTLRRVHGERSLSSRRTDASPAVCLRVQMFAAEHKVFFGARGTILEKFNTNRTKPGRVTGTTIFNLQFKELKLKECSYICA